MQGSVHSSLEGRSYGSQNAVQCLWSSLDEAQQAQMTVLHPVDMSHWVSQVLKKQYMVLLLSRCLLQGIVSITHGTQCLLQRMLLA